MKKILIVAPYSTIPSSHASGRFIYIAEQLSGNSDVTLITSNFCHRTKKHREEDVSHLPFNLVLLEETGYEKNVSVKRLKSISVFCENLKQWLYSNDNKYDVIYSAYPLIKSNIVLLRYASKTDTKFIVDVQDVWPESFSSVHRFLDLIPDRLFPFFWRANQVYSSADAIIAVSKTYLNRAVSVNKKSVQNRTVYLGSDWQKISNAKELGNIVANNCLNVIYVGTLSYSYDVRTVVNAINIINKKRHMVNMHILSAKNTHQYKEIESIAGNGVYFHGLKKASEMYSYLKSCDVAVNAISKGAKQSVTNKLSDFLSVGLPVLNSQTNEEVLELLKQNDSINYIAENVESCVKAIEKYIELKKNGKLTKRPNSSFDRSEAYKAIYDIILN